MEYLVKTFYYQPMFTDAYDVFVVVAWDSEKKCLNTYKSYIGPGGGDKHGELEKLNEEIAKEIFEYQERVIQKSIDAKVKVFQKECDEYNKSTHPQFKGQHATIIKGKHKGVTGTLVWGGKNMYNRSYTRYGYSKSAMVSSCISYFSSQRPWALHPYEEKGVDLLIVRPDDDTKGVYVTPDKVSVSDKDFVKRTFTREQVEKLVRYEHESNWWGKLHNQYNTRDYLEPFKAK